MSEHHILLILTVLNLSLYTHINPLVGRRSDSPTLNFRQTEWNLTKIRNWLYIHIYLSLNAYSVKTTVQIGSYVLTRCGPVTSSALHLCVCRHSTEIDGAFQSWPVQIRWRRKQWQRMSRQRFWVFFTNSRTTARTMSSFQHTGTCKSFFVFNHKHICTITCKHLNTLEKWAQWITRIDLIGMPQNEIQCHSVDHWSSR